MVGGQKKEREENSTQPSKAGSQFLFRNLGLNQRGQLSQRLLPTEVAHVERDGFGDACLRDAQLRAAGNLLQGNGDFKSTRKIRVVELVRVSNQLVGYQFKVFAAKGVTVARREVLEGHLEGTASAWLHVMNPAGETVGRKPLAHRLGLEERPVDPFGLGAKHSMKADCARKHGVAPGGLA